MPAWLLAFGPAIGATIVGFLLWRNDRMREQRERDSRALSFAISLLPVLERAQYRATAESNPQAAFELFDEHADDPNEALKILPGLPGLLSEAHLLPPDEARAVQRLWAKAREHDALADRIKRARARQSSELDQLKNDWKASWPILVETVQNALETLETYVKKGIREKSLATVARTFKRRLF